MDYSMQQADEGAGTPVRRLAGRMPALAFVATVLVLMAAPLLGMPPSMSRQVIFLAIALMTVTGLNISLSYAGEMALGQSFLVALGAYATAIVSIHYPSLPLPLVIVLAGLVGAAGGLVVGIPGLRLGAWSLAVVTFLTVLILPDILTVTSEFTGGLNGLAGIPLPTLTGTDTLTSTAFHSSVIFVVAVWFLLYRNLILSRWAVFLLTMRASPISAHSLGIPTYQLKLMAYVIGAIPAGIAGCLLAFHASFVGPEMFTLEHTIAYLASLILGGAGSVYGPIIGTAVVELGPFQTGVFKEFALLVYGLLLVVCSVLVPGGIAAALRRVSGIRPISHRRYQLRSAGRGNSTPPAAQLQPALPSNASAPSLAFQDIEVSFGAAVVLNRISFEIGGGITGLIGPNGSGKTTLLNAASGFVKSQAGTILLNGTAISHLPPWKRARSGLSRTFQTPQLPQDVLVVEAIAAAAHHSFLELVPAMLRLPSWRRMEAEELARAYRLAMIVGLRDIAHKQVSEIPAGQQRLVDIARAMMNDPKILLLDEPAAGLSDLEIAHLERLLANLRDAGMAVVLIDHNLALVSRICQKVIVLDAGSLIFEGPPDQATRNPGVREAYIGTA